jgi:hypothetical protein
MINWIYQPSGKCPVQAEGYFLGKYFYFRSRHESATIEFFENITFHKKGIFIKYYVVGTTKKQFMAGWFPHWYCRLLIYKGCLMYLLKFKSNC